MSQVWTHRFA
ncbi:hypothetical protein SAMN04488571_103253 [Methanoculleus thermophilus]|uniref:Uncharacterized protein n=1 Tax=Methanoculleus thermophilus TaxID=2200 RepID=A0A1G8YXE0_9EURY|nr:hypothetical protein SAMN04488571_103253 [Methanoculleus thermophilus]